MLPLPSTALTCLSSALPSLYNLEKITFPEESGFSLEHVAYRFSVAQGIVNKLSVPYSVERNDPSSESSTAVVASAMPTGVDKDLD